MRHLVKTPRGILGTNFEPLFKNLFDAETPLYGNSKNAPAVNIAESEKEYHIEFALAGYAKKDLKINLEHDTLTVSATSAQTDEVNEEAKQHDDKKYTRREFSARSFSRSFYLPEQVNEEDIKASFENGILTLSLPKVAKAKAKEINIK